MTEDGPAQGQAPEGIAAVQRESPHTHQDAHVAVLTVIPAELSAVRRALQLSNIPLKVDNGTNYWFGKIASQIGCGELTVVLGCIAAPGNPDCAAAATEMLALFHPQVILLVGIAAGIRDKVRIGNVVLSDRVFAYEPSSVEADGVTIARPESVRTSHSIEQDVAAYLSGNPMARALEVFAVMESDGFPDPPNELVAEYARHVATSIEIKGATIASGEKLLRDPSKLLALREHQHGKIEVGEMEAHGLVTACRRASAHWLVVRGISDFGDELKDDRFHGFASAAAAAVLADFLRHGLHTVKQQQRSSQGALRPDASEKVTPSSGHADPPGPETIAANPRRTIVLVAILCALVVLGLYLSLKERHHPSPVDRLFSEAANYERTDGEGRPVPGARVILNVTRVFNSGASNQRGIFGVGWRFAFEAALDPQSSTLGELHLVDELGHAATLQSPRNSRADSFLDSDASLTMTIAQFSKLDKTRRLAIAALLGGPYAGNDTRAGVAWIAADSITVWRETGAGRMRITYGLDGRLLEATPIDLPTIGALYAADGRIDGVHVGNFRCIFSYDSSGRVSEARFDDGSVFLYGYNTDSRLAFVKLATATTPMLEYGYDASGLLNRVARHGVADTEVGYAEGKRTSVKEPNLAIEWRYEGDRRISVRVAAPDRVRSLTYTKEEASAPWQLHVQLAEEPVEWYANLTWCGCHPERERQPNGTIIDFSWDAWGNLRKIEDSSRVIEAIWDDANRMTSFTSRPKAGRELTVTVEFNEFKRPVAVRDSRGRRVDLLQDGGFSVSFSPAEGCSSVILDVSPSGAPILRAGDPGCAGRAVEALQALFWRPEQANSTDSLLALLVLGRPPTDL